MAIGVDDGWSAADPTKNLYSTATPANSPHLFGGSTGWEMQNRPYVSPEQDSINRQIAALVQKGIDPADAAILVTDMPPHGAPHPTKPGWFYNRNTARYEPPAAQGGTVAEITTWLAAHPEAVAANAIFGEALRTDGRTNQQSIDQLNALGAVLGGRPVDIVTEHNAAIAAALGLPPPNITLDPGTPYNTPAPAPVKAAAAAVGLWLLLELL